MKGAVHVEDVKQAVLKSIETLDSETALNEKTPVLTVDGAYEYTPEDLKNWDKEGGGSSFKKYYEPYYELAIKTGLDPARKPKVLNIEKTRMTIGYVPTYSLKNFLQ